MNPFDGHLINSYFSDTNACAIPVGAVTSATWMWTTAQLGRMAPRAPASTMDNALTRYEHSQHFCSVFWELAMCLKSTYTVTPLVVMVSKDTIWMLGHRCWMNPQKERLCFRGSYLFGIDYRWTTSLALASRASLESDASTTSTTALQSHAQMEELAQVSWEFWPTLASKGLHFWFTSNTLLNRAGVYWPDLEKKSSSLGAGLSSYLAR